MMIPGRIARMVAISVSALVALHADARAEDVWRLAGTFNGWNTGSDDWKLGPVEGEPGVYAIECKLARADHRFKFVKNGRWEAGHLGMATGESLEQPGADIPLDVPIEARFRITLDTNDSTWSLSAVNLPAPVPVVSIRGVPTLGRMFELDLRKSLTNFPHKDVKVKIFTPGTVVRSRRATDGSLRFGVVPSADVGNFNLHIRMFDGPGDGAPTNEVRLPIFIAQRYFIELEFAGDRGKNFQKRVAIRAYGNNVYRTLIDIPEPGVLTAADIIIQGKTDDEDVVVMRSNGAVRAGTYLVEIADGRVTEHDDARISPRVLVPGNWHTFRFISEMEIPPGDVYLIGDINNWTMPGAGGAIRMTPLPEGEFEIVLGLADGAHRYQYVWDDAAHPDPKVAQRVPAPNGSPASLVVVGPRPEDFEPARAEHVNVDALRHDPASRAYVAPISRTLGLADVAIATLPDDAERVVLYAAAVDPSTGQTAPISVPMRRERDHAGFDRWTARLHAGTGNLVYSFSILDGQFEHATRTYEFAIAPDPLQIPTWAMGAVWYQIFPDRFRNGNPLNDPRGPSVFLKDWTSDWYEIEPREERAWRERYDVAPDEPFEPRPGGPLFHVVYDRRYGGDLQGVAEKLDELKELGVTGIYFNPIFEAESLHKYDATDYRHVDDNLGTPSAAGRVPARWEPPPGETLNPKSWQWTEADRYFVEEFLPAAKERGIRVIIDGVFNHTGRSFFAFEDLLRKGAESEYTGWYEVTYAEDGSVDSWHAWDGRSGWLPEFRETNTGDLAPPVKRHVLAVTKRWMDPNGDGDPSDGIDGWRLDVPLNIGGALSPFWIDWRRHVKQINPDALIVAEIWGEDEAAPFLTGNHFDTQMHYPFATAVTEWPAVRPGMTSRQLGDALNAAFDEAPQTNLIHQNLFGSHDTDRYVSKLLNPNREYDAGNRIQDGATGYREERPPDEIYTLSILGVAIQATYLGAPMIYYGDEYGMWGADDPSDRKPLPWPDVGPNKNPTDNPLLGLRPHYVEWFTLRRDEVIGPILRYGDVRHLDTGDPGVFAFVRSLNGRELYVVANRNDRPFDASRILPDSATPTRVGPVRARHWLVREAE